MVTLLIDLMTNNVDIGRISTLCLEILSNLVLIGDCYSYQNNWYSLFIASSNLLKEAILKDEKYPSIVQLYTNFSNKTWEKHLEKFISRLNGFNMEEIH